MALVIYPAGWNTDEVRLICGSDAGQYRRGSCNFRWAFVVACLAEFLIFLLTLFAFLLAGRQAKYLLIHASEKRTTNNDQSN
jgi:LHFPL tetraspan subfamily member protein